MQETTTLNDLPEDIIMCIMSKLSLRVVLNFSLVSKKWIHVPYCLERIKFNAEMFKDGFQSYPEGKDIVKGVNQFLKYYSKQRSMFATPLPLCQFRISLCLSQETYEDLDAWISLAFRIGVANLFVFLWWYHEGTPVIGIDNEKYIFPWKLLDNPPIMLKRLYLMTCIFDCHLTSVWTSLVHLQLYDTDLTQHDTERISHCFPKLELIVLRWCEVPAKLTLVGGPLSSLWVEYCTNLEEIEVLDSGMLQEFGYRGFSVAINLNNPHQLTKITFSIVDSKVVDYIFQNLHLDFPTIKSLSIYSDFKIMLPVS